MCGRVWRKYGPKADVIVVSATPGEALVREWQEHDIAKYVAVIAGQEMGTKAQHLEYATKGRYDKDHVLMVGDAPGDLKAARANEALFYPIVPGKETESWKRFHDEAFDRFLKGQIRGRLREEADSGIREFVCRRSRRGKSERSSGDR